MLKSLIQPNPETKILSLTTLTLDTTFMIMHTLSLYKDSHLSIKYYHLKSATHAIVKLKRSGVNPSALILFYRAGILSALSY